MGSIRDLEFENTPLRYIVLPCAQHPSQTSEVIDKYVDVDQAIEYENSIILSLEPTDPARFTSLNALSLLLHVRFIRSSQSKDLALAITYRRRWLAAPKQDIFHLAFGRLELARLFHTMFHFSQVDQDLTLAIRQCKDALGLMPMHNLSFGGLRALCKRELGLLYACRFARAKKESDLRKSYESLRTCIRLMATKDPERGLSLTYIIHILIWHHIQFGNDGFEYLEDAIAYQKEAISDLGILTSSDDHKHSHARSTALDAFAELLRLRFESTGNNDFIKEAAESAQDALALTPTSCHLYPKHLTRYVSCLITRFRAFGDLNDINEAYKLHAQLVKNPSYHPQSQFLHSFGNIWITAYEWFEKSEFLERAIGLLRTAVGDYLEGDTDARAELLSDLGKALALRFQYNHAIQDINEAIKKQNDAVSRSTNDERRAPRLLALGTSLGIRYDYTRKDEDIRLAQEHHQKALQNLHRRTHIRVQALYALAETRLRRYRVRGEINDRTAGIELLREAARAPYGLPHDCLRSALLWASFMHKEGHEKNDADALSLALDGYEEAITRLLPRVAWIGLNMVSRLVQLHSVPKSLARDAAACAFRLTELTHDSLDRYAFVKKAVELLDWGRSVMWSQAAQFRTELYVLRKKHPELADSLQEIAEKLDATGLADEAPSTTTAATGPDSISDATNATTAAAQRGRHGLAKRWEELSQRVRIKPEFEHFNLPMPFSELKKAAKGGFVLIVNVSQFRCDGVIIMTNGDIELVPLPDLTEDKVKWAANDFRESLVMPNGVTELRKVMHDLWRTVAGPMLDALQSFSNAPSSLITPNNATTTVPRVRWCLTGQLAFLPIHAAYPKPTRGPDNKLVRKPGVLDLIVSTYIPALSALVRVENLRRDGEEFRMLAVTHSHVKGYVPLRCAEDEVKLLRTLPNSNDFVFLSNQQASVESVKGALKSCTWVHFACHGQQDSLHPMQSSLILDDGPLPVSKVAAERSIAGDFAMLLACESAKGSDGFSDEAIHIAAGLHFAGFRSVIATMFSILDDFGPIVAEKVYEYLFREKEGGQGDKGVVGVPDSYEAAFALREALLYLRDVKKAPIREWCPFIHFGI